MNQNPEQLARDRTDQQLTACGWMIAKNSSINRHAGVDVVFREFLTDAPHLDYVLLVGEKFFCLMEPKRRQHRVRLTMNKQRLPSNLETKPKQIDDVIFTIGSKRKNSIGG